MKHEKLTLRLEEEMIEKAKRFACKHGSSVSRMVANFFDGLEAPDSADKQHGPRMSRLHGFSQVPTGRPVSR